MVLIKKLILLLFVYISVPRAFALNAANKERISNSYEHGKNYQDFVDTFNDIADEEGYKTPDGKRGLKSLVADLMKADPSAASIIMDYGDYFKLVFLLDNGWDVKI